MTDVDGAAKAHTSREFDRELQQLRRRLLEMAQRADEQVARAVEGLSRRDAAESARVISDDEILDSDEVGIDELAFLILARRQPVASDLRFVMAVLKVVTDVERIGDLAVNIAKRARDLIRFERQPVVGRIEQLAGEVRGALSSALDALVTADPEKARAVIEHDDEIDVLNAGVIQEIISRPADTQEALACALALSSVSRYLERIGDHSTNIAEMVIYFVVGRDVRHHMVAP